jgi:hypothetical protein
MPSSVKLRRVAVVRTDVSEEQRLHHQGDNTETKTLTKLNCLAQCFANTSPEAPVCEPNTPAVLMEMLQV